MTTREYLRARATRFFSRTSPIGLLALPVTIWIGQSPLIGWVLIALIVYFAAYIVFIRRTPCLRCSAPLLNSALNWGSKLQPASCCPHCGLGIDEQVADSRPLG